MLDFGQYSTDKFTDDPLTQVVSYQDQQFQILASQILKSLKKEIANFYKQAFVNKDIELISLLHYASMALLLAANPENLIGSQRPKGCRAYFADFQAFLRQAIHDREYQKFVLYASSNLQDKPFFRDIVNLIYGFCIQIFKQKVEPKSTTVPATTPAASLVHSLTGNHKDKALSKLLEGSYRELHETLKRHPNGPLFKALDLIREDEVPAFDPLILGNISELDSRLETSEGDILLFHSASPTPPRICAYC